MQIATSKISILAKFDKKIGNNTLCHEIWLFVWLIHSIDFANNLTFITFK